MLEEPGDDRADRFFACEPARASVEDLIFVDPAGSGAVGYQAAFFSMTVVAGIMVALGLTLSARSAGETEEAKAVAS